MKIKIKSREEIEKTLKEWRLHIDNSGAYFSNVMLNFCGKIFDAEPSSDLVYSVHTPPQEGVDLKWFWHKDWYEVVECPSSSIVVTSDHLMDAATYMLPTLIQPIDFLKEFERKEIVLSSEDLMDIELMDEMLGYFLEDK